MTVSPNSADELEVKGVSPGKDDVTASSDVPRTVLAHESDAIIPGRSVFWANVKFVSTFAVWFSLVLFVVGVFFDMLPFQVNAWGLIGIAVLGTISWVIMRHTNRGSRAARFLRYDGEVHLARDFLPGEVREIFKEGLFDEDDDDPTEGMTRIPVRTGKKEASGGSPSSGTNAADFKGEKSAKDEKPRWRMNKSLRRALKRHTPQVLELLDEKMSALDESHNLAIYRVGLTSDGSYVLRQVHLCAVPCSDRVHSKGFANTKNDWTW